MPQGTASQTFTNLPAQEYVADPSAFQQETKGNLKQVTSFPVAAAAVVSPFQLPQSGIVSKLWINFNGSVVGVGTSAVTSDLWPYKFLDSFVLSAGGQNDLFSCDGVDLQVLRFIRWPSYTEKVDQFTGSVGGGDTVAAGTYPINLTWEVPLAMDDFSLVGSLFLQNPNSSVIAKIGSPNPAALFSTAFGTSVTITGTWTIAETMWEVPYDSKGRLVIPDLSRLHGFNKVPTAFTNTGDVPAYLIRSAGSLERLFVTARSSATNRLSALPSAASSKKIDRLRLQYGINQTPFDWNPASLLLSKNNLHYGSPAPYDRLVVDTIRENPVRDAILPQGLTNLQVITTVDSGVTVTAGSVELVQEMLF